MYIASDYPYTYSDLQKFTKLNDNPCNDSIIRTSKLCTTLAGNICYLYIITNYKSTPEEIAQRPAIVFTARAHPGLLNI